MRSYFTIFLGFVKTHLFDRKVMSGKIVLEKKLFLDKSQVRHYHDKVCLQRGVKTCRPQISNHIFENGGFICEH